MQLWHADDRTDKMTHKRQHYAHKRSVKSLQESQKTETLTLAWMISSETLRNKLVNTEASYLLENSEELQQEETVKSKL